MALCMRKEIMYMLYVCKILLSNVSITVVIGYSNFSILFSFCFSYVVLFTGVCRGEGATPLVKKWLSYSYICRSGKKILPVQNISFQLSIYFSCFWNYLYKNLKGLERGRGTCSTEVRDIFKRRVNIKWTCLLDFQDCLFFLLLSLIVEGTCSTREVMCSDSSPLTRCASPDKYNCSVINYNISGFYNIFFFL